MSRRLSFALPVILAGLASTPPLLAQAAPIVIYDHLAASSLDAFRLVLEGPLALEGRAVLVNTPAGLTMSPGDGGFTLWKFADLTSSDFTLSATFQIPPGIRYSNSGIYFLYEDPTRAFPQELPAAVRGPFLQALANARARSNMYGKGPYEADFFARELQIIAGFEQGLPADNHGPAAFYGVTPTASRVPEPGTQHIVPYDLFIGDTYELTVEARGERIETFLRSLGSDGARVRVSDFQNVSRAVDPIRGGTPRALMLQAFPNNGGDVKGPVFKRIVLDQRP